MHPLQTHATRLIKFTEVILKCIHCKLMQLVWSNLQKLFWNASITNSCNSSDQIYRSYILKCIHCNSCNSSDQINRSCFEMHPLQLVQLVWSNLQKLFWNASITTHATGLIKFTEVTLKMHPLQLMQLVWSNLQKLYFEMHPLQLMQLVWSNLQKLFWNASITTHATCLIKFTEVILKWIHCNWVATAHGHKKRDQFLSEKSITPGHVGWKHNPFHSWR
jgi:hypothetical protein